MPPRFHPPRQSPLVIGAMNRLYPAVLLLRERVTGLVFAPEDWGRLAALRGRRALLLPNHPSETEPGILVGVARRLGEPFFYVATHELFAGFTGWLVQHMGAFSIRRGWPDRAALRTARALLAEQDRKLVLFPEGETHMQSDLILPLHKGAIQLGFWSLLRLEALGKPVELPVVPLVIRYRYVGDARPTLARGLSRLERDLGDFAPRNAGLPPGESLPLRERLLRAGLTVLGGIEREYGIAPGGDIDARIAAVYDAIALRVTQALRVPMPPDPSVRLRMRALFNAAFDYLDALAEGKTFYERRLQARRAATARTCLADLWRVQNFMAIGENSLADPLTVERAGEVLFRLEKEVYGSPRTLPRREALIRVGEPFDLAERLPEYRVSRKRSVALCTTEVEERLRALLHSFSS